MNNQLQELIKQRQLEDVNRWEAQKKEQEILAYIAKQSVTVYTGVNTLLISAETAKALTQSKKTLSERKIYESVNKVLSDAQFQIVDATLSSQNRVIVDCHPSGGINVARDVIPIFLQKGYKVEEFANHISMRYSTKIELSW